MLLVVSGLEVNPGTEQHTLVDWELAEVVTEMDDLKTKRTKCAVCDVGDLRPLPTLPQGGVNPKSLPLQVFRLQSKA